MSSSTIKIGHVGPKFQTEINKLAAEAFGPGRFTRTAFRLREHCLPRPELSYMAEVTNDHDSFSLAGSVELTDIMIGDNAALLLGPLVVSPHFQKLGIGRELMNRAIHDAANGTHNLIILVGDLPYYAKFGFKPVPRGQITLPGPVDPARLLAAELKPGALNDISGRARNTLQ